MTDDNLLEEDLVDETETTETEIEEETRGEGDNSSGSLEAILQRIEALEETKKGVSEDIKAVKQEGVASGLDRKMIQEMLKLRAMDAEKRMEQEQLRDNYIEALDLL